MQRWRWPPPSPPARRHAGTPAHARDARPERLLHEDTRTVLVASHRACWKRASENAFDGIRACIADGTDIVEVDVRTTRDGALVLMHDEPSIGRRTVTAR